MCLPICFIFLYCIEIVKYIKYSSCETLISLYNIVIHTRHIEASCLLLCKRREVNIFDLKKRYSILSKRFKSHFCASVTFDVPVILNFCSLNLKCNKSLFYSDNLDALSSTRDICLNFDK